MRDVPLLFKLHVVYGFVSSMFNTFHTWLLVNYLSLYNLFLFSNFIARSSGVDTDEMVDELIDVIYLLLLAIGRLEVSNHSFALLILLYLGFPL